MSLLLKVFCCKITKFYSVWRFCSTCPMQAGRSTIESTPKSPLRQKKSDEQNFIWLQCLVQRGVAPTELYPYYFSLLPRYRPDGAQAYVFRLFK